ncbi:MAG: preprotein translocase subunit SecA [Verrucomicrobia bacterium]|nr:MAG: preprotein translocase subunit SecA [Verrucomicrobiota bacterium]
MQWLLKKIIGTKNERDLKNLRPLVARINALEQDYQKLTADALKAKTQEFKQRLAQGEKLDDIMCEAFAVVKNACRRLCGQTIDVCGHPIPWEMVPFDVQLIGGMVLHQGKIAEMATGEGKTLVATAPVYLNALTGKNVNVVTVNDYLARRDSEWMGAIYRYLGLTVGCIQNAMNPEERRTQYACDITYGTNSEFGFDYLRDKGMAMRPEEQVQRGYYFAIVDEVDSILIDEARTPLIISGPAPYSTTQYAELKSPVERLVRRQRDLCNKLVTDAKAAVEKKDDNAAMRLLYQARQGMPKNKQLMHMMEEPAIRRLVEKIESQMLTDMNKQEARELREELYFTIDEKGNDASLTEKGCETMNPSDPNAYVLPDLATQLSLLDGDHTMTEEAKIERRQKLQDEFADKSERIHAVDQLIRAYSVYERDVEYVVQENQVIIVDEFTGRLMPGRRWSDGLHQAVEAKEGVTIERETQTLATITIQNYFRMYEKLAGMTGTAETEADEFHQIYKLDVVVIPTNRPVRRVDQHDFVYKTQREKFNAIIEEISACYARQQPVLVGTVSVEASELLSRMLRRKNIPHNVLNAKNHEREAEIVANAGQPGAITIATNMAGRGTDIKLGSGVVWVPRETITSTSFRLEDKLPDGQQLRKALLAKPAGLHVIGSERHESRRIDRQLRGRCARQGDPGSSRFYVSLEDNLMRLFGSDRIAGIMERLGIQEGEVLEHPWLNKSIETAQRRVEQHNFAIRKRTLDYDDVMNKQREIIYGFRSDVVATADPRTHLYDIVADVATREAEKVFAARTEKDGDAEEARKQFIAWANVNFPIGLKLEDLPPPQAKATPEDEVKALAEKVFERVKYAYEVKGRMENPESLHHMERYIILQAVDAQWQDYLRNMDTLRQGVGLRAYGQRDPLVEYKHEAYAMFSDLMERIKSEIAHHMFRAATSAEAFQSFVRQLPMMYVHEEVQSLGASGSATASVAPEDSGNEAAMQAALKEKGTPIVREGPKVGRNDPCPCGSGKKYKKCHGINAA